MGVKVLERLPGLAGLAPSRATVRRLGIASLVANVLLVVTGGAVRLTDSGLGCPDWPRCTAGSFVVHDAMGVHGFIEFGNRLLTFVLTAVAILTWAAAMRYRPRRDSLRWLATLMLLGIPAQAVVGGVAVLTDLNPWVVSLHLLASLAIICVSVAFVRRVDEGDERPRPTTHPAVVLLGRATFLVAWVVLYVGTVVTGSGPHAGDASSPRTGLDAESVAQLHADLVCLLVGLTIGSWVGLRVAGGGDRALRAASWLLAIEAAQAGIGFGQYFADLPTLLVGLHMLGAALVAATATWLVLGLRERGPVPRLVPTADIAVPASGREQTTLPSHDPAPTG